LFPFPSPFLAIAIVFIFFVGNGPIDFEVVDLGSQFLQ
jgi:hypothetical protein